MGGLLLVLAGLWLWRRSERHALMTEIRRIQTVERWNRFAAIAPLIEAEHRDYVPPPARPDGTAWVTWP